MMYLRRGSRVLLRVGRLGPWRAEGTTRVGLVLMASNASGQRGIEYYPISVFNSQMRWALSCSSGCSSPVLSKPFSYRGSHTTMYSRAS